MHLGLDPQCNGYKVYIPHLNRITTAYHLTFQERKSLHFTPHSLPANHLTHITFQCAIIRIACYHNTPKTMPHLYETIPTQNLRPNPPRCPNRPSPTYVKLPMYLDDVINNLLAVRHDDTLATYSHLGHTTTQFRLGTPLGGANL